jgi:hypothetical protein
VFGSIAEIEELALWSDKKIAELAFQASEAVSIAYDANVGTIVAEYKKQFKRPPKEGALWPGVTTTLVVDNTAYISTSIKGPGASLYQPARIVPKGVREPRWVQLRENTNPCRVEVIEALERCQLRSTERFLKDGKLPGDVQSSGHRTRASCGEPMAALAFCTTGSEKKLAESNAKIVSVRKEYMGKGEYAPACGPWEKSKKVSYRDFFS